MLRALGVGVRGAAAEPLVCLAGTVGVGGSGGRAGRTSVFAMCGLYREDGLVGVRTGGWFWCCGWTWGWA